MQKPAPLVVPGIVAIVVIATIAVGWRAGVGDAADVPPADATLALTHELMSPFCPGLTLAACPSPAAFELRREIRSRFDAGETREAITSDLLHRFGIEIDGTPRANGFGAVVWAIPFIVAVALGVAVRLATRGDDARGRPEPIDRPVAPHLRARLDDELEQMD